MRTPKEMRSRLLSGACALGFALAACAPPSGAPEPRAGTLPPIPARAGPLAVDLVYPGEGAALGARDSTFVFGNVGTGGATLSVNGAPVEVEPNGAFLAFLPIPPDGEYELVATARGETARLTRRVRVPAAPAPAPAFVAPPAPDTARPGARPTPIPAFAPRVAVAASERPDRTVVGTAVPGSGTPYHWFFPDGTLLAVTGERQGQYRVALTGRLSVWVDSGEVRLLPQGTPAPDGSVGTVAAIPREEYVDLRLSTSRRLPFRVDGEERGLVVTVYGAETRTNVMLYGATDPLVRRMEWEQPADDEYRLRVELNEPLWGFLPFWDEAGNLVVRVRRTPPIDPGNPLRGLYIGVDAGHPPGGAIGPTRLTEAEANLSVARRLVPMLRERGAKVLEIRPDTAAVDLGARPLIATDSSVHLLVSLHNDAFPDGIDPFENNGTHVFYNQAQSLDLAREIQAELLAALGLRDLGVSRRDLALVRPTWMPSVLTESTFLMIPEQEAALRDPEIQERIARAHLQGIEDFLRSRAAAAAREREPPR